MKGTSSSRDAQMIFLVIAILIIGYISSLKLIYPMNNAEQPARAIIPPPDTSVRVVQNPAFGNQSIHANTTMVKIGSYNIINQQTLPVNVTGFRIGATVAGGVSLNNFHTLKIYKGTNLVASTTSNLNNLHTFSGITSVTIPAGATQVVDLYTDTGAATSGTLLTDFWATVYGGPSGTTLLCGTTLTTPPTSLGCRVGSRVGQVMVLSI